MHAVDETTERELPVIEKIIADETWLEGERRHHAVPANDPVVIEHVCAVVLRIGAEMRATLSAGPTTPAVHGGRKDKPPAA